MEQGRTSPEDSGSGEAAPWEELAEYAPEQRSAAARSLEGARDWIAGKQDESALDRATAGYESAKDASEQADAESSAQESKYQERQLQSEANRYLRESEAAETVMQKAIHKNLIDFQKEAKGAEEVYERQHGEIAKKEKSLNQEYDQLELDYEEKKAEVEAIDAELDDLNTEAKELLAGITKRREGAIAPEALQADLARMRETLERTRSKNMRKFRRDEVRALERELKEAERTERRLVEAEAELGELDRQIEQARKERKLKIREIESINKRAEVLGDRLEGLDGERLMVEYEYGQARSAAREQFDKRQVEIKQERESVKERYGAEAVQLGRELVGGGDGAGILVRGRIERAKEVMADAIATFAAGRKVNSAAERAEQAKTKLAAREAVLTGKREQSETVKAELERRAKGRELEVAQVRAAAEARRDERETAQARKSLEAGVQGKYEKIQAAELRDTEEAESDELDAVIDREQLLTYYPEEEARVKKELAESEAEIEKLSAAADPGALAEKVEALTAELAKTRAKSMRAILEKDLKLAREKLKNVEAMERARQDEVRLLEEEKQAILDDQAQLEAEKAAIAEAEVQRAERAKARAEREVQLKQAAGELDNFLAEKSRELEAGYDERKRAREEKLRGLLEAYRPEVAAMGRAALESEAEVVQTRKASFLAKMKAAAAAVFSL